MIQFFEKLVCRQQGGGLQGFLLYHPSFSKDEMVSYCSRKWHLQCTGLFLDDDLYKTLRMNLFLCRREKMERLQLSCDISGLLFCFVNLIVCPRIRIPFTVHCYCHLVVRHARLCSRCLVWMKTFCRTLTRGKDKQSRKTSVRKNIFVEALTVGNNRGNRARLDMPWPSTAVPCEQVVVYRGLW